MSAIPFEESSLSLYSKNFFTESSLFGTNFSGLTAHLLDPLRGLHVKLPTETSLDVSFLSQAINALNLKFPQNLSIDLSNISYSILDGVGGIKQGFLSFAADLNNFISVIETSANRLAKSLEDFIKDFWLSLSRILFSGLDYSDVTIFDPIKKTWEGISKTLINLAHEFAKEFYDFVRWMWEMLLKFLDFIDDKVLPWALSIGHKSLVKIDSWFKTYGSKVYNGLETLILGYGNVTPENVGGIAFKAYAAALSFGVGAHLTAAAIDMCHPTHATGIQTLPAILGDLAGYGRIAAATMGVIVGVGIRRPFEYNINAKVRPTIPGEGTLSDLVVKREISISDFQKNMAYHGYSNEWISAITNAVFRELSYREITYIYEDSSTPADWTVKKMRRIGYADEDIDVLIATLNRRVVRTQRNDFYYKTFALYQEGYIDEAQFDSLLSRLNLRPEAHALAKQAADMAYLKTFIDDSIATYKAQYENNLISDGEFSASLYSLGIKPSKADLLVNKSKAKLKAKVLKEVETNVEKSIREVQKNYIELYTQQYRADFLDKATFETNLLSIGVEPEVVNITVDLEELKKLSITTKQESKDSVSAFLKVQDQYRKAYLDQYRNGFIDDNELRSNLLQIGIEPELVEGIVLQEETRAEATETSTPTTLQ